MKMSLRTLFTVMMLAGHAGHASGQNHLTPGRAAQMNPRPMARYDLDTLRIDANGLPLNPRWGTRVDPAKVDPARECGIIGVHGSAGHRSVLLRDFSCFSDAERALLRLYEPDRFVLGGAACSQAVEDGSPSGHLNWYPITLTGTVQYAGSLGGKGGDYDFTLNMATDRPAPATKWNETVKLKKDSVRTSDEVRAMVHLEFDFRETTDLISLTSKSQWWRKFGENSRTNKKRDRREMTALLGPGRAVVTGLFNLDLVHGGHSEIHPVFGMAILVKEDTAYLPGSRRPATLTQQWVVLARDRGNEGNCAPGGSIPFRLSEGANNRSSYRIGLGAPDGASGPPMISNDSWVGKSTSTLDGPAFHWHKDQGLEIEFGWNRAESTTEQSVTLAEITMTWPMSSDSSRTPDLVNRVDKPLGTSAVMAEAKGVQQQGPATPRLKPFSHADEEEVLQPGLDFDAAYYVGLGKINDDESWKAPLGDALRASSGKTNVEIESARSHAVAARRPRMAAELFDRTPPVIGCFQVRWRENPRCRGDWQLAPVAGLSLTGGFLSGISLENPRNNVPFLGPVARYRWAIDFAAKHAPEKATDQSTMYLFAFQPALLLGPIRKAMGIYGVLSPLGVGAELRHEDDWRAFRSFSAGVGIALRSGFMWNWNVETFYNWRTGGPSYWSVVSRFPLTL